MEKKLKPLFISTPRGDKNPFDDYWKGAAPVPIRIDLSDVHDDNISKLMKSRPRPHIPEFAKEYERKMLGFATLKRTLVVYVTFETKTEIKESVWNSFITWEFSERRPKGKECQSYDFTNLVTMSEQEFESLPHTENYETAKMYRDAMRKIMIDPTPPEIKEKLIEIEIDKLEQKEKQ